MAMHTLRHEPADLFVEVAATYRRASLRPEIHLTEVPAPRRIAPYAVAFSAEVVEAPDTNVVLGTGRFVLLYDPDAPAAWQGQWRIITFARAELESELATDPLLGAVGWSWLEESLQQRGAEYFAEAGTVTRVVNESFGALTERPSGVEMEIRASWTPPGPLDGYGLDAHLEAWGDLMCTVAGIAPLPEGVSALPGRFV